MFLWIICLFLNIGLSANEVEIAVENSFIYGSLEESNSKHLVVFISSSGPTDRNGNSSLSEGDNNSLKFLWAESKTTSNDFWSLSIILSKHLPIDPVEPSITIFFFIY